jgi:hypothetical protein
MKRRSAWSVRRIHHSIGVRIDRAFTRLKYHLGLRDISSGHVLILPWSPLAAIPGNPTYLPSGPYWQHDDLSAGLAAEILKHHIRIFTEHPIDISILDEQRSIAIRQIATDLPNHMVSRYIPIDWHSDFHRGYRWDPDIFFHDVRIAPVQGADIKVPRELSRFQHVAALAYGSTEESAVEFVLQVVDWIVANPYGRGVNWACSMDIALRAVNWIWGIRLFEEQVAKYQQVMTLIGNSLHDHGRHIYENLEYWEESTGNHYLADIAGLIYIGAALPDISESDLWLTFGIQELVSEMRREVLPDGACHEASTHYHRLVAELFVGCAALIERIPAVRRHRMEGVDVSKHTKTPVLNPLEFSGCNLKDGDQILPTWFYSRLADMVEFTLAMRKPNGLESQIGDNDSGRVHKLMPTVALETRNHDHLLACVGELLDRDDFRVAGKQAAFEGALLCGGIRVNAEKCEQKGHSSRLPHIFTDAGIVVTAVESAWLCVTCGPSGRGGRGGHGHNDKNSFELSVKGLDIIVDGGCPAYTQAPHLRNRYRSTAMHSTICVGGIEQNRWKAGTEGLFRLEEKGNPSLTVDQNGVIEGVHGGYGALHRRRFALEGSRLLIEDNFVDDRERYITFNCDPGVTIEIIETHSHYVVCVLRHQKGLAVKIQVTGATSPLVDTGAFGLGYMQIIDNSRLIIRLTKHVVHTELCW